SNSQILSNTADYGGGLYSQATGLTITQNEFRANTAAIGGGALRLYANNATVAQNDIVANTAGLHGGGLYVLRGQLLLSENTIAQNTIDNSTQGWGGGLHLTGSAHALLQNNLFENNSAIYGGGLRLFESNVQVYANVVRGNTAAYGGGLALQGASEADLQNNAIIDNTAAEQGAGIYVQESTGIFAYTTLARNGGSGEAVVVAGSDSVVTMQNSIFADHLVGVNKLNNNSDVLIESTLWDNNDTETIGTVANIVTIAGNAAFAADGYHLLAGSAAIDAAIDIGITSDIDGYVRPYYNGFDLGADEWSSLIALKTVNQPLVQPNDLITYTIVLQNPLAASVSAVLTDTLPNEVTPAAPPTVSAGTWQVLGQQLTWEGTVPAASEVTIVWQVQVVSDLTQGQVISNQATVKDNVGTFTTAPAVAFWPVQLYLPMVQR
ncbi:MAG: right-handed parallel beta-helix repeat-containing protein, partial [Anaerolineales bacterium]|nr:right-handed parallel beta-helix repeat-containing protein [Anaerolineales bacterium]